MQLLKRDGDSDSTSGCSADMSNTDSGKGASEEGEKDRRLDKSVPIGGRRVLPHQPRHHGNAIFRSEPPLGTSTPSKGGSGRSTPNYKNGPYKSRSPITYMVGRDPKTGRLSPLLQGSATGQTKLSNGQQQGKENTGCHGHNTECHHSNPNCNPGVVCSCADKNQCMNIKQPIGSHGTGTQYEGIHLRTFSPVGYQSPSGTLRSNSNNSNRNSSVCSDDGGSTTSGSYVVDLEGDIPSVKAVDV